MKKKLILTASILCGVIVLLVILSFTLFGLKEISFDLRTYGSLFTSEQTQASVINSGKFKMNRPVFFQNKQAYIDNMEKANPYLKIINIETVFPNKFIIRCVDREELFAIKVSDQKYFIVDEDFKVLNVATTFDNNQTNAILLSGEFSILNTNAGLGDFLTLSAGQGLLESFVSTMKANNRVVSEQKALFKSVNLKFGVVPEPYEVNVPMLEFTDFLDFKMTIIKANDDFTRKVNCLLSAHAEVPDSDKSSYELEVYKNSEGEIFCLQMQIA